MVPSATATARVAGVAVGQRSHSGNGRGLACGGAKQGLIVGDGDVAFRGMIAVQLPVDLHRLVGSALLCQLAGLAQLIALRSCAAQRLDLGDVRVVGIHAAQAIEGGIGLVRRRPSVCSLWPRRPGLQDCWVRRGESAATVERPCRAGRATQGHGLYRSARPACDLAGSGCGLLLGEATWSARKQATRNNRKSTPSPAANPHRRFHSTFSSPPGPNRNLPSRKPVANRARF